MTRPIIAVDDSEIARELITLTLSEFGYDDVRSFGDPHDALAAMTEQSVPADLILLDVMMPGMDGIELCARIRGLEAWRDTPIIMLTTRSEQETLSQAFMAGANDYVTKPFQRIELQARIKSLLRLKSELDRRRVAGQGSRASARRRGTIEAPAPGLLATRTGLTEVLGALEPTALRRLGLVALRIDSLRRDAPDYDPAQARALSAMVSDLLAQVPLPAGDALVQWEEGCFCLASLSQDAQTLVETAGQMARALDRDGASALWQGTRPSLSAGLALPGQFETLAAGLGDAFAALEEAQPGGLRIAGAEGPGRGN
ncbi:response regulator [Pseudoroseicyclus aestuarii]|uniref:DNA-binding response OmpR family regulator n=1 Tax=Pseudoroseicyclus aestuarii TaxID=1795041 RepID=A0A318SX36_9RHOB|nr:response regulator [Pseudoroseicyclus aestuarii]PYE85972.1 DNA-binding response OmpR family regulator [Pseudoroseicyclus aestuarii]